MAIEWMPVVTNVGVGGGAGVVDQLVQNWDEKRKRTDPALSRWKEGGTYLNYGVPIAAIFALAFGFLKRPWADRAVLIGSQLAGRKATYTITKAAQSAPYRPVPDYRPDYRPHTTPPARRSWEPEMTKSGAFAW